jgi:hypothetical protein
VYSYDARDRLTSETHTARGGATRSFTYGYDPVTGLRTTKSDSDGSTTTTTEYSYTSGNRLASVGTTPIAWDGYGRQTGDAEGRTFRWGLADQLLAIDEGGANLETNWHDAAGLRVAGTSAGGMEFFLAGPAASCSSAAPAAMLPGPSTTCACRAGSWSRRSTRRAPSRRCSTASQARPTVSASFPPRTSTTRIPAASAR